MLVLVFNEMRKLLKGSAAFEKKAILLGIFFTIVPAQIDGGAA